METYDPVLLLGPDDDAHERLAAHEAVHGKSGKEPFFVRLVGIAPEPRTHGSDSSPSRHSDLGISDVKCALTDGE